jgi:hypothetical protein
MVSDVLENNGKNVGWNGKSLSEPEASDLE